MVPFPRPSAARDVFDQVSIGSGLDTHRLLDEPVEEFPAMPRPATVEAERELIEVVVEMRRAHRTLVRSQEPALEQRHDQMDPRQQLAGWSRRIGDKLLHGPHTTYRGYLRQLDSQHKCFRDGRSRRTTVPNAECYEAKATSWLEVFRYT